MSTVDHDIDRYLDELGVPAAPAATRALPGMEWLVGDRIMPGFEPKVIRTCFTIDPRGDIKHMIAYRETLAVKHVDADRRCVTVETAGGETVSLHPSEFEVLEFQQ